MSGKGHSYQEGPYRSAVCHRCGLAKGVSLSGPDRTLWQPADESLVGRTNLMATSGLAAREPFVPLWWREPPCSRSALRAMYMTAMFLGGWGRSRVFPWRAP